MQSSLESSRQSEDTREILQQRVALFGLASALISFGFLAVRVLMVGFTHELRHALSGSFLTHALSASGSLLIWLLLRRGTYRLHSIHVIEALGLVICCTGMVLMSRYIGVLESPFFLVMLALGITFFARAVTVPSTATVTFVTTGLAGVPIVLLTYVRMTNEHGYAALISAQAMVEDGQSYDAARIALIGAVGNSFWWTAITVTCAFASKVVYGLRREIRQAHRLGQYVLEERIGAGGMGEVYRAGHLMLRRPTAIKLLRSDRMRAADVARFEREVQLTAQLTHPNVVTVFDYGRTPEGIFYYAMEYLDGAALDQIVASVGALPEARVASVLVQIVSALRESHGIGLIHRDIKPGNVLLCKQGGVYDVVKVVDFGLAKPIGLAEGAELTHADTIVGTPMYMAPESITSPGTADGRSDLYAVGAVGYYLLVGANVFAGSSVVEICGHHLHSKPVPPSERLGRPVHAALERFVLACLEKDPQKRPATAHEALRTLEEHTADLKWSEDDARGWWRANEARVKRAGEAHPPGPHTIAIDLAQRAGQLTPQ